jgi:hypothetical protein
MRTEFYGWMDFNEVKIYRIPPLSPTVTSRP